MDDLFDIAEQRTDEPLNINAILTAVCKNRTLLKQTAAALSVDESELDSFLISHIFAADNSANVTNIREPSADNVRHTADRSDEQCSDNKNTSSAPAVGSYKSAVIHTDGGSRGNPGSAGCGIVIEYEGGPKIGYYHYLGVVTNNEAEYAGLVKGLTVLSDMGVKNVAAFADSELMCHQINGRYRVKHPVLKTYYDEAAKLISAFETFSLTHVSRDKNKDADEMANMAMDLKKDGETKFTVAG